MPAIVAGLRFPHSRVMLPRTRLAYVHLRNMLTDAKRDRSARLSGYVAVWLPEEFLVLYLQRGEVVNATQLDAKGWRAIAVASALERIPAEPEYGEICFHEAEDDQISSMYAAQTQLSDPWPSDLQVTDPVNQRESRISAAELLDKYRVASSTLRPVGGPSSPPAPARVPAPVPAPAARSR